MKKNKKQLKLEDAFVPVEEQPYEVPENWCWTKLGVTISISKEKTDDFSDTSVKYVGLEHLENNKGLSGYGTTEGIKSLKNIFHTGQILYGKLRPYLNKHDIASFDGVCSTDILVIDVKNVVDTQFVNKFLDMDSFISYTVNNSKGINLPRVSGETIMDAVFPLPPLPEQQRIVERIKSLFSKLDEAKEKAQAVVDGFLDRKATILHRAFTGGLTKEWRENKGVDYSDTWKMDTLGNYANSQYGYTEKSSSKKIGPKFLRITDIQDGQVIWKDVPYCKINEELKETYLLNIGDIVVARTGATTGKSYMVIDEIDAVYASYLIRISINRKDLLRSKYLYYFLQCPLYWQQITELSSGIAQPGVNGNKLKTLQLPIPNVEEQDKIVEILDYLAPVEQKARDSAELALEQIDAMKKSILAKAFRGELGTNNPSDESSIELLKQVIKE